jgi:Glycosyl hydrolase family 99
MSGHIPGTTGTGLRRAVAACGLAAVLSAALPATAAQAGRSGPAAPARSHSTTSPVPVFAYYYQWFSHASWNRAKTDYPLIGTYSSSDPAVIQHQIRQAKSAGLTGFIVSWKDTALNDQRLRLLMRVAARERFKLAMIYQGLDFTRHPLPLTEVATDFETFARYYAPNPVFYRLGGKPLTIWSGTWAYTHAQIAAVTSAVRGSMRVLATEKNVAGYQRIADVVDGDAYYWSSVNPATYPDYSGKLDEMSRSIHRTGEYWIAPFAPGFDARLVGGHKVVPRDHGRTLRTEYATAVGSSPDAMGLISWNEFSENSFVEPSLRYRYQSLDVLRELLHTSVPAPTGPAEPSDAVATGPHSRIAADGYWPNMLRLAGFPVVLVVAVSLLSLARRRPRRRPSLHTRSGHRNRE